MTDTVDMEGREMTHDAMGSDGDNGTSALAFEVDSAMTGAAALDVDELRTLAILLTKMGYPTVAITDSYDGANNAPYCDRVNEPPDSVFWAVVERIVEDRGREQSS